MLHHKFGGIWRWGAQVMPSHSSLPGRMGWHSQKKSSKNEHWIINALRLLGHLKPQQPHWPHLRIPLMLRREFGWIWRWTEWAMPSHLWHSKKNRQKMITSNHQCSLLLLGHLKHQHTISIHTKMNEVNVKIKIKNEQVLLLFWMQDAVGWGITSLTRKWTENYSVIFSNKILCTLDLCYWKLLGHFRSTRVLLYIRSMSLLTWSAPSVNSGET